MLGILYFSYCPPIIVELLPSGAQAPRWEPLRYTNILLDQCSVDESALDESVVEESTPTRMFTALTQP